MTRRRLLRLFGAAGTGLVIAACSNDEASPATTRSSGSGSGSEAASGTASSETTSTSALGGDQAGTGTTAIPDCVLTPEDPEGPFYADLDLVRRDITDGRAGEPLQLQVTVVDAETCQPLPDAAVDVWHADAGGLYSNFTGQGDAGDVDTTAESFLRGLQPTDGAGVATFDTIYPGWYPGRTTHIHLKVHLDDRTLVTTQLYFPDDVSSEVYALDAYAPRGQKDTSNQQDGFSAGQGSLLMTLSERESGLLATHTVGIAR